MCSLTSQSYWRQHWAGEYVLTVLRFGSRSGDMVQRKLAGKKMEHKQAEQFQWLEITSKSLASYGGLCQSSCVEALVTKSIEKAFKVCLGLQVECSASRCPVLKCLINDHPFHFHKQCQLRCHCDCFLLCHFMAVLKHW